MLLAAAGFGLAPTVAKVAYAEGSNTLTVVVLRAVVSGVLIALFMLAAGEPFRPDRRAIAPGLLASLLSMAAVYGFLGAAATLPVAAVVLIFFLHPLGVAAIQHWRGRERLTPARLALALAAFAGLAVALGPRPGALDPGGLALAVLSAVAVTGLILVMARVREFASSSQANVWIALVNAVGFGVVATALGGWALPAGPLGWAAIAAAGAGIAVALVAFFAAFRHLSPVRATMISCSEPVLGILLAAALLGETLAPWQWAGVAVTVIALTLFEVTARKS
ncbi:MAG: DMT family transporter [Acetobacteraceae bacterium]|nr:DMT family transporter [Acetobacteraceae bacterium]